MRACSILTLGADAQRGADDDPRAGNQQKVIATQPYGFCRPSRRILAPIASRPEIPLSRLSAADRDVVPLDARDAARRDVSLVGEIDRAGYEMPEHRRVCVGHFR